MDELISVVIPVYNVKKYLNDCLESVAKQSYRNYEAILVDDGSSDGSELICDEWCKKDSRVKVIHKENAGVSAARNDGIAASNGEYIAFLDSDDLLQPDALKILYDCAKRNDSDMVIGNIRWVSEEGAPLKDEPLDRSEETYISREDFWCRFCDEPDFVMVCGSLYDRHIFDTIEFFDGKINEDYAIQRYIVERTKKIMFCNKIIYNYRMSSNSIMRSAFTEKNLFLIGERLNVINYILGQDFSAETKYYFCRRQFPDAMDGLGDAYKYLNTKDSGIKKKLNDLYCSYKPIARIILKGIDGSIKPDKFTRISFTLYLASRKGFFLLRSLKKGK